MVVALKLIAFAAAAVYAPRWRHYSLSDALVTIRANLFGTLLTASVLLLVARIGLSRGVLVVDFLLCTSLTIVARGSFRFLEDAVEKCGRSKGSRLPSSTHASRTPNWPSRHCGASPSPISVPSRWWIAPISGDTGRLRGYPILGGADGIRRAVRDYGVNAVVVVDRRKAGGIRDELLEEYLATTGALDVFVLRITLEPG